MGESDLETEIQDCLDDLAYTGLTDLRQAVEAGLESAEFTSLVTYLAQELGDLASLEDRLGETEVESQAWSMELSSLLRELGCPYSVLTQVSFQNLPFSINFLSMSHMNYRERLWLRPDDCLSILISISQCVGSGDRETGQCELPTVVVTFPPDGADGCPDGRLLQTPRQPHHRHEGVGRGRGSEEAPGVAGLPPTSRPPDGPPAVGESLRQGL